MSWTSPEWLAPTSLDEALQIRAERGEEATVVAGGTFVGILMNQGFMAPTTLLSLRSVPGLGSIEEISDHGVAMLTLGAMVTHRSLERSELVRKGWPSLSQTFSLVASPRVRNQATVGGVLVDADYASDPPAMLTALRAIVVARSVSGERQIPMEDFVTGHYQTALNEDEILTEVRVPAGGVARYRKFRSRSAEDRPCVAVAVSQDQAGLRVVVGAVADRPQLFPDVCSMARDQPLDAALASEIAQRYAEGIEPISDSRGSAGYRRRIIAVEVRRALEDLSND